VTTPEPDTYSHGHHESVLRSHRWRTAANSAAYLLAHLRPGMAVLDVGCGPGTITLDLARAVDPGLVLGIDAAAEVLAQAEAARVDAGVANCRFEEASVYALPYGGGSFDVVHAHQVLQHLTDPVSALAEMARVVRPGGAVAARDSDYSAFAWLPADPLLDRWLAVYHQITDRNGAEADAGRHLLTWACAAGLTDVTFTSSTWTFATDTDRHWWASLWADRVRQSSYATQAVGYGLADPAELEAIAAAWLRWAAHPAAVFVVVHGEILARST
jgi:SAM-dependent methyltransferase